MCFARILCHRASNKPAVCLPTHSLLMIPLHNSTQKTKQLGSLPPPPPMIALDTSQGCASKEAGFRDNSKNQPPGENFNRNPHVRVSTPLGHQNELKGNKRNNSIFLRACFVLWFLCKDLGPSRLEKSICKTANAQPYNDLVTI